VFLGYDETDCRDGLIKNKNKIWGGSNILKVTDLKDFDEKKISKPIEQFFIIEPKSKLFFPLAAFCLPTSNQSEFLSQKIEEIQEFIDDYFIIEGLVSDGSIISGKSFEILKKKKKFTNLYLIYDIYHILKNIRNNLMGGINIDDYSFNNRTIIDAIFELSNSNLITDDEKKYLNNFSFKSIFPDDKLNFDLVIKLMDDNLLSILKKSKIENIKNGLLIYLKVIHILKNYMRFLKIIKIITIQIM
jgi:hypothetical protein